MDLGDEIFFDGGGDTFIWGTTSADQLEFTCGGTILFHIEEAGGGGSDWVGIPTNTKFSIGGNGNTASDTYFIQNPDDDLQLIVGGDAAMTWDEANNEVRVGVDDTGFDVKFFGATSGSYMLWDQSSNDLCIMGDANACLGIGRLAPTDDVHIERSGEAGITLTSTTSAGASIRLNAASNDNMNYLFFNYNGSTATIGGWIRYNHDSTATDQTMEFKTGDDDKLNLCLKGDGFTGIMDVSPKAVLEVNGYTRGAGLEPVILIDGHSSNGFSMIGDNYIDGTEQHISIGCEYSTGALFLGSKVTGAIDQQTSHADGWKSTTDLSVRGAAVVIDGNSGQFEFWHAENATTTAMDSSKTLTLAFKIDTDGDTTLGNGTLTAADDNSYRLGVGRADPAYKLDVLQNKSSSYAARFMNDGDNVDRYGIFIQCGTDNGSTASETIYILAGDGDGNQIGKISHGTDGNFAINATSDARLKENIADTQIDGLAICNQIKVREFNWKDYKGGLKNEAGFIAQEVQEVWAPAASGTDGAMKQKLISEAVEAVEAVEEVIDNDPDSKHYGRIVVNAEPAVEGKEAVYEEVIDPMSVAESAFIPVMMKAIQELSDKVTALENA